MNDILRTFNPTVKFLKFTYIKIYKKFISKLFWRETLFVMDGVPIDYITILLLLWIKPILLYHAYIYKNEECGVLHDKSKTPLPRSSTILLAYT